MSEKADKNYLRAFAVEQSNVIPNKIYNLLMPHYFFADNTHK